MNDTTTSAYVVAASELEAVMNMVRTRTAVCDDAGAKLMAQDIADELRVRRDHLLDKVKEATR